VNVAPEKLLCRLCTNTLLPSTSRKTGGLCLDCFHSEKHRIEREAREATPGCARCDGSTQAGALWFDWRQALQGKGEFQKYPKYLRRVGTTKGGERHVCSVCSAPWFLQGDRGLHRMMMMVPQTCEPQFEAWCKNKLVCPAPILAMARSIGGAPPDFEDEADEVKIPCSVTMRSGEHVELAVLSFSRLPPIPSAAEPSEKRARFRLVDELASIAPSRFALPRRVRLASALTRLPSVDRDWLTTTVVNRQGKRFQLSRGTLFFDHGGVVGEELRLAYRSDGMRVPDKPHGPVTVFTADWFDAAKELRIAGDPVTALLSWVRWSLGGSRG
jgi:hypothetical protein